MADTSLLTSILKQRGGQYGHFFLETCLRKGDANCENIFTRVTALKPGQPVPSKPTLEFKEFIYAARTFESEELLTLLQERDPILKIDQCSAVFSSATLTRSIMARRPSNNDLSDWPIDLLELRSISHNNYVHLSPLVSHNAQKIFRDVFEGITDFMGVRVSNDYNNGLIGAALLVLPDYRIRIRKISGESKRLTLELEKDDTFLDGKISCLVEGVGERQDIFRSVDATNIEFDLKNITVDKIDEVKLFITDPLDMIDYYEQNALQHTGRIRWLLNSNKSGQAATQHETSVDEGSNLEINPVIHAGEHVVPSPPLLPAQQSNGLTKTGQHVFLSHASEDKESFVIPFARALREKGVNIWLDTWEILPGDSLVEKIMEEGLKQASDVIVVISEFSVNKPWVKEEINAAFIAKVKKRTRIIPIVIGKCDVPEALNSIVWERIEDISNFSTALHRVINAIHNNRERPSLGRTPSYVAAEPVDGLNGVDLTVLRAFYEEVILTNRQIMQPELLFEKLIRDSISKEMITDSLVILDEQACLKVKKASPARRLWPYFLHSAHFFRLHEVCRYVFAGVRYLEERSGH